MSLLGTLRYLTQHPLNRGRPLAAIARFASWQIQSRLREETRFQWIGNAQLLVRRGMTGATGNIYCGLHEFPDMAFALHLLRPGDLFVDVGANVGSYTILASAVAGADVVAIEPDGQAQSHLQANIRLNGISARVKVEPVAVGETDSWVSFTKGRDTMNKVVQDSDSSIQTQQVPVRRLDDLLAGRCPVLIKLDVEGYEDKALAGAEQVLGHDTLLAVQSEATSSAVLDTLTRHGFKRWFYEPFSRQLLDHPRWHHNNGLFVRNSTMAAQLLADARSLAVLGHQV